MTPRCWRRTSRTISCAREWRSAAHHAVGAAVALAEKLGKPLGELTTTELKSVNAAFGSDAKECFNLSQAMARRNLTGAPGTKEVARQLARWRVTLSKA